MRQVKLRNHKQARDSMVYFFDEKGKRSPSKHKGPHKTQPKHGKKRTFVYSEPARSAAMGVRDYTIESKTEREERQKRDAIYFANVAERNRRYALLNTCDPKKFPL